MSRITIKKENWFEPMEGDRLPTMECPGCGCLLMGNSVHGIKDNGEVYQSIVCPTCDFHEFVTLEAYDLGEIPHK